MIANTCRVYPLAHLLRDRGGSRTLDFLAPPPVPIETASASTSTSTSTSTGTPVVALVAGVRWLPSGTARFTLRDPTGYLPAAFAWTNPSPAAFPPGPPTSTGTQPVPEEAGGAAAQGSSRYWRRRLVSDAVVVLDGVALLAPPPGHEVPVLCLSQRHVRAIYSPRPPAASAAAMAAEGPEGLFEKEARGAFGSGDSPRHRGLFVRPSTQPTHSPGVTWVGEDPENHTLGELRPRTGEEMEGGGRIMEKVGRTGLTWIHHEDDDHDHDDDDDDDDGASDEPLGARFLPGGTGSRKRSPSTSSGSLYNDSQHIDRPLTPPPTAPSQSAAATATAMGVVAGRPVATTDASAWDHPEYYLPTPEDDEH